MKQLRSLLMLLLPVVFCWPFEITTAQQPPWNTTLLSTHPTRDTSPFGGTRAVYVVGSHAYLADYHAGFRVVDISNPLSPVEVGSWDNPNKQEGSYNVFVSGNYAYVANDASDIALQIFDISNPRFPNLVAEFQPPSPTESAFDVEVQGNYAYLAHSSAGLRIINVANPSTPSATGRYDTPHQARHVIVRDEYAYVGDSEAGLQIINVSNPSAPTRTGFWDRSQEYAQEVALRENYAFMAYSGLGLVVFDVTNKANPDSVAHRRIPDGYGVDVCLTGQYACVAAGGGGLQLFDITNPLGPILRGTYDSPGFGRGVFTTGNVAYLADESTGLLIIRIDLPVDVSPEADAVPRSFGLHQNYPNPFNPSTVVRYDVARTEHVTLRVHDILGRVVATLVDRVVDPGVREVTMDASNLPSGSYFCRMQAGTFTDVRRMAVVK